MNVTKKIFRTGVVLCASGTLLLTGCKKDPVDVTPVSTGTGTSTGTPATSSSNGSINKWILSNMRDYYYWNSKIPANPDTTKNPREFFNSLLYEYGNAANPERDRFSWIQESAAELTALLNGESKTTGLDFTLVRTSATSTDVVGVVTYVPTGSPADKAGFKRNDMFYSVNGINLTTDQSVLNKAFADESATQVYGMAVRQNGAIVKGTTTRTVTPTVFQENPVYKDSVFTDGNRKIAYLVYNQFVPGPNGAANSTQYDDQFNAIFGKFKAQGVNEIILDLRYNGGGSVASSTKLASLIVKGVNGQTNVPYSRTEWNSVITPIAQKQYGDRFFYTYFGNPANNIGNQLSRVYVITTRRTASASELLINGLRPFMTVNTIGTTSYGKNVGSITIKDDKNPKNLWGLQPIVFRSFNKNNESDYWNGFKPTVEVTEPYGSLVPLGDLNDPLLAAAVNHMKGLISGGRKSATPDLSVSSSDDFRANANSMYMESPFKK